MKRLFVLPWVVMIAFMMQLASCNSPENNPSQSTSQKQEKSGQELYQQKCAVCHGTDGALGAGGAAVLPKTKMDLHQIKSQILNGRKAMPPFKGQLTDQEIERIATYVLTLKENANQ